MRRTVALRFTRLGPCVGTCRTTAEQANSRRNMRMVPSARFGIG
jgi:hypothetical protein